MGRKDKILITFFAIQLLSSIGLIVTILLSKIIPGRYILLAMLFVVALLAISYCIGFPEKE